MASKIEMLMLMIATVTMLITLGQLAIAIVALRSTQQKERKSWRFPSRDRWLIGILFALSVFGFGEFASTKDPGKLDIYKLCFYTMLGSMGYTLAMLKIALVRISNLDKLARLEARALELRVELVEKALEKSSTSP